MALCISVGVSAVLRPVSKSVSQSRQAGLIRRLALVVRISTLKQKQPFKQKHLEAFSWSGGMQPDDVRPCCKGHLMQNLFTG